ncbi:restriction endonuclease subunit S [Nocardiopsis sp. CNS-639]|uniref:restriction endonuclease subunit S n=1 Tax=Nocardiopsis sp. CNS-639 TaxID=1169153 RepID=UPI0003A19D1C|nr:restriction endonuclease subunit S [Nocardiopsis sp. CNS-639]
MTHEIWQIPDSWTLSRIDRVATVNARIGWKALTAREYQPEGYAFLATPNIKTEDIDFDKVNYISEFRYEESPALKLAVGDVLLAKDGNTLGICNVVRHLPRAATVNGSIAVIRPFGVDGRFLRHVINSSLVQGYIGSMKDGMGVPHLFQWDIKRIPVPLPSVEEQRRIADFLDIEVRRIVRIIATRRRQLELFEERASSLLSERLISGIVSDATGEFPWPWLPLPREEVPLVRLGYVCQVQGGVTVDASRKPSEGDVTRPYLRVANVKADRLDLESVTSITVPKSVADRSTLLPGDVLMTEGGDIDKLGRGTVWRGEIPGALHQNHVFALRPDPSRLDAEYLALLTRSVHGRCYFEATGVKSTNLASTSSSKVKSFPIPLPALGEQRSAVIDVNRDLEGASRLRAALESQITLLEERKRALITAAVTGQIDVTTARGADVS